MATEVLILLSAVPGCPGDFLKPSANTDLFINRVRLGQIFPTIRDSLTTATTGTLNPFEQSKFLPLIVPLSVGTYEVNIVVPLSFFSGGCIDAKTYFRNANQIIIAETTERLNRGPNIFQGTILNTPIITIR